MAYKYKGVDKFSSNHKIASYINRIEKEISVLDVGCNAGFIGRALRQSKWKGYLAGLDKQKDFKNKILKVGYDEFINIDVESKDISKIKRKYDLVVFADVLEHLINPQEVLIKIRKKLKKNGIIIFLPNITNDYIRLSSLMGKFDYSDRGILDRDHKLFYTKKTAVLLVKKSNLKIFACDFTPIPLPVLYPIFSQGKPFFYLYYLLNQFSIIKPSFFAYQLIFICQEKLHVGN